MRNYAFNTKSADGWSIADGHMDSDSIKVAKWQSGKAHDTNHDGRNGLLGLTLSIGNA